MYVMDKLETISLIAT